MLRNSCESSMGGMPDYTKRYVGFKSYKDAHTAWANYVSNGTLPMNIPPITPEIAAVADKLRQPRDNMDSTSPVVHNHAVRSEKVIASGRGADHQGRDQTTSDRLEKDVENGVDECSDCAGVGGEVFGA